MQVTGALSSKFENESKLNSKYRADREEQGFPNDSNELKGCIQTFKKSENLRLNFLQKGCMMKSGTGHYYKKCF